MILTYSLNQHRIYTKVGREGVVFSLTTTSQDISTPATALVAAQALAKIDPVEMVKEVKKLQPLAVEYNGKSFSSKGATIKMQPGDMAGVMQSTGDIPLMCGFDLKNTVEGDPITWHLETSNGTDLPLEAPLRTSASSKDTYLGIKWPDGQNSLKLSVISGDRSLSYTLQRPDWKVSGLQVADGGRVAKAGETLYLVKAPLKNEKATVSWTSNIDPMLLNKHYFVNGTPSPLNLTAHKIPYSYSESPSKTTYRLNALGYDESVKVEVVDKYKYDYKVVPGAISTIFDQLKNLDNKFGKTIEKIGTTTGLKPSFKIEIAGSAQNNEVFKERFLQDEKQVGASAKFGLSSSKDNPIPGLSYSIPYIGSIGGYWRVSFEVSLAYNYLFITKNNPEKTHTERIEIPLKANGGLEIGAKIAILEDVSEKIDVNVKAYGKGAVYAQIKIIPTTKEYEYEVGLEAVVGGFSGTIKAAGITVFDQKFEFLLLDKTKWLQKK